MKVNYKRMFLWSAITSLALGGTVAYTRKSRRSGKHPLAWRKMPQHCQGVLLWTERYVTGDRETRRSVYDRYYLQPTPFKVWSVLDLNLQGAPGETQAEGSSIYHVTHVRVLDNEHEEEQLQDRFYGVISATDASGHSCGNNCIARGGLLVIKKCFVGGSINGVESGEVHRPRAPILNYRIDYSVT